MPEPTGQPDSFGVPVDILHRDATLVCAGANPRRRSPRSPLRPMSTTETPTIDISEDAQLDASIVQRALSGDRDAMAELYDRHADRIHTMCVHMLGDPEEAADTCAQVFLVALQRLHQLREPAKLRSWLYAITRNEVYRRTRDRARTRPVGTATMSMLTGEVTGPPGQQPDPGGTDPVVARLVAAEPGASAEAGDEGSPADPDALAALLQDAAAGLDDRDRTVLELNLAQGLEGQELADALGVRLDNAYQMTHRMRERLERSVGALLVATAGRPHCDGLDEVASKWDGNYDVLWRKRFSRHVDRCERCQRMKQRLPKAVLSGVALSQAAQSAVLAAPISVRRAVLDRAPAEIGSSHERRWSNHGFPRGAGRRRGAPALVAGAAALVVVLGVGGAVLGGLGGTSDPVPEPLVERGGDMPGTATVPPSSPPADRGEQDAGPVAGEPPAVPDTQDPVASEPAAPEAPPPGGDGGATGAAPPANEDPATPGEPTAPVTNGDTAPTPGYGSTGGGQDAGDTPGYSGTGPTQDPGGSGVPVPGWDEKNPPVIWVPPTFTVPQGLITTTSIPMLK